MSKKGATSVNMKPCDPVSAQLHCSVEHRKKLDYIRHDLSHLNVEWHAFTDRTLKQCFDDACALYEKVNKQKPQLETVFRYDRLSKQKKEIVGFAPIRCDVVVIKEDTTEEDLVRLCEAYQKEWGVTPLAFSMHKDEGHYAIDIDEKTGEVSQKWLPNLHAHIFFDIMEYRPDPVEEIAPEEGQEEDKSKKKKKGQKQKKKYGKTIKFSPIDTSRMQDLAAEVLGMERGEIGSKRTHQDQIEYKRMMQAQELANMAKLAYDRMMEAQEYERRLESLAERHENASYVVEHEERRAEQLRRANDHTEAVQNDIANTVDTAVRKIIKDAIGLIEDKPVSIPFFGSKKDQKKREELKGDIIAGINAIPEAVRPIVEGMKIVPEDIRQEYRRMDEHARSNREIEVIKRVEIEARDKTNIDLRNKYKRETELLDAMNMQELSEDVKGRLLDGESVKMRKKWYDPDKHEHTGEAEATLNVSNWKLMFNGRHLKEFLSQVWMDMKRAAIELRDAAQRKLVHGQEPQEPPRSKGRGL